LASVGSLSLLGGALLMKLKVILGCAAALLLAVLWLVWFVESSDVNLDPVTSGATVASAAAPDPRNTATDLPVDPPATPAVREPVSIPAGGLVVRGTAHFETNRFPRARLRAMAFGGPRHDELRIDARVVADEQGEFTWTLEPTEESLALRFESMEEDFYARRAMLFVVPGEAIEPCQVVLHRLDCAVSGTVTDQAGQPIEGASVHSFAGTVTTDAQGGFLARMAADYSMVTGHFVASARGFARAEARLRVEAGIQARLDFRLQPEARVAGQVRDARGEPIEGAEVDALRPPAADVVRTDATGAFELRELDPTSAELVVRAVHPHFVTGVVTVRRGASPPHVLVLKRGARIAGVVLDPAGRPQPGASVFLDQWHAGMVPRAVTGQDGSFMLQGVATGRHTLVARRNGVGVAFATVEVPADAEGVAEVKLQLQAGHFLAGQVVDSAQQPIPGVKLLLEVKASGAWMSVASAVSASDGRFRVEGLPGGSMGITYGREGFLWERGRPEYQVDRSDLLLTLERAGGLAGRVLDAETGEPVDVFRVRIVQAKLRSGDEQPARWPGYRARWSDDGMLFSGTGGRWNTATENLAPGWILGIEISAPGTTHRQ
jgi:hypothetical protein